MCPNHRRRYQGHVPQPSLPLGGFGQTQRIRLPVVVAIVTLQGRSLSPPGRGRGRSYTTGVRRVRPRPFAPELGPCAPSLGLSVPSPRWGLSRRVHGRTRGRTGGHCGATSGARPLVEEGSAVAPGYHARAGHTGTRVGVLRRARQDPRRGSSEPRRGLHQRPHPPFTGRCGPNCHRPV